MKKIYTQNSQLEARRQTKNIFLMFSMGGILAVLITISFVVAYDFNSNLIAWWQMENQAEEINSNIYNLTGFNSTTNLPVFTTGKIGLGSKFNGTAGRGWKILNYSDALNFNQSGVNFTISFWYNATSTATQSIMSHQNGTVGWLIMHEAATNKIRFIGFNGTIAEEIKSKPLNLNTWQMLTITRNSSNVCVFINGTQDTCALIGKNMTGETQNNLTIGVHYPAGNYPVNGMIDEIGMWTRALSVGEISDLFNSGVGISYGCLIGRYRTFNNSLCMENLIFTGNQNITRYLSIPNSISALTSAYLNLSGYNITSNIQELGIGCSTNIVKDCIRTNPLTYSCNKNFTWEYWISHADSCSTNVTISLWNYSSSTWIYIEGYNYTSSGNNQYEKSFDCNSFGITNEFKENLTRLDSTTCQLVYTESVPILNLYSQLIQSFNSLTNTSLTIGSIQVWNYLGQFSHTNNKTSNIASTINKYLNATYLIGTNYIIPFIFHSDTVGILRYFDIEYDNIGFIENSQTFSASTYEATSETYSINISYDSSYYSSISSTLIYNGTSYLGTQTGTGNTLIFSKTLNVPNVLTITNKSFYWNIVLTNSSGTNYFNSSWNNQTINPIVFTRCNTTYPSPVFVNFSFYNETTLLNINASIEATFLYKLGGIAQKNYSIDSEVNSSFKFCTNYNSTFITDVTMKAEADGFNSRTFNFYSRNYTNNSLTEEKLYLLPLGEGTNVIVQVKDSSNTPAENIYVDIYRYYSSTGAYTLVMREKTNLYGEFVAQLVTNMVKYKFEFRDSGNNLLKTATDVIIACKATICILPFILEDLTSDFEKFANVTDYTWSFTFNNNTNIFTFAWNDVSGVSATNRLYIERFMMNGTTIICNNQSVLSSGSLTCSVGSTSASYLGQVFRTVGSGKEKRIGVLNTKVGNESRTFGTEGLMWSFFLLMTFIACGYWKPPVGIALYLVGVIILTMLPMIYLNWGLIIAQFVVGCIFIWAFRG